MLHVYATYGTGCKTIGGLLDPVKQNMTSPKCFDNQIIMKFKKSNLDMAVDYRVLFPGLDCGSYRNCQNESLAVIACRDHMTQYMGSNPHEMFHSSLFENKEQNESNTRDPWTASTEQ